MKKVILVPLMFGLLTTAAHAQVVTEDAQIAKCNAAVSLVKNQKNNYAISVRNVGCYELSFDTSQGQQHVRLEPRKSVSIPLVEFTSGKITVLLSDRNQQDEFLILSSKDAKQATVVVETNKGESAPQRTKAEEELTKLQAQKLERERAKQNAEAAVAAAKIAGAIGSGVADEINGSER